MHWSLIQTGDDCVISKVAPLLSFRVIFVIITYFLTRRQQEMGPAPHSFHSIPNLLPLSPASAQQQAQRPQTRPKTAAGPSHVRARHRGPSSHPGSNHPPPDWTSLPTGRDARLPHHPSAAAHRDLLSHAGSQDRKRGAHCRGQCRSSDRLVLVSLQCSQCQCYYIISVLDLFCMFVQELYCQSVESCWPRPSSSP